MTASQPSPTNLSDELENILDDILEPNADDETPDGPYRNYRTLVLHDSQFQNRTEKAKAAITAAYAEAIERCARAERAD